jgi:hypothetical protein
MAAGRSAPARSCRRRGYTGGEGLTGHDLRDLGDCLGGDVFNGWRWNTAGDEEGRWPCRVTGVPGEGLVNMGK